MRIVVMVAGAGGMYCGACTRDVNLISGLMARGHDVEVVALYTPLHADEPDKLGSTPIFFGGINVYLQQVSSIFRHTPDALDRLLDKPSLLNWVSKFAIRTAARDLGPMTVSVLAGKNGRQKKELARLLKYLQRRPRPDVVSITNSLLSGIAPELRTRLDAPVVCALQGEDGFVAAMPEPYRSQAENLMRANSRAIDLFISPGEGYADKMSEFLAVSREKIRVIHAGIDPSTYRHSMPRPRSPFVIGYLSIITPAKGLDLLVDAFVRLTKEQGRDVVLHVAGKVLDKSYWNSLLKKITDQGLASRLEYVGDVDLAGKIAFLRSLSVFSVPSRIEESRGMAVMEAMASGIPVVVPDTGVFPEMMALTQGGAVFPSGNSIELAEAIARIMDDPDAADAMGLRAAAGIEQRYCADRMAEQTETEYSTLLE